MRRICSALVILFAASSAYATPPPTDRIVIDVITVNGTGCPATTAAIAVSPDNTKFTISYSAYTAQVGVGTSSRDFRKNCNLNLLVHVPPGFTYRIHAANYRGFASLAASATGVVRGRWFFQGETPFAFTERTFSGPLSDEWEFTNSFSTPAIVVPCGPLRNLNINTELRVDIGTSDPTTTTSLITMDSTDGAITTTYFFEWRECP